MLKTSMEKLGPYSGAVFLPLESDCESFPDGEYIVELKKNRNVKNHRRYFTFMKLSFSMQDEFDEPEIWRKYLQMKAGFFDEIVTKKGIQYWPRSISWDELDEIEFKKLFNQVVNAFLKYYGTGLDDIQINTIVCF